MNLPLSTHIAVWQDERFVISLLLVGLCSCMNNCCHYYIYMYSLSFNETVLLFNSSQQHCHKPVRNVLLREMNCMHQNSNNMSVNSL